MKYEPAKGCPAFCIVDTLVSWWTQHLQTMAIWNGWALNVQYLDILESTLLSSFGSSCLIWNVANSIHVLILLVWSLHVLVDSTPLFSSFPWPQTIYFWSESSLSSTTTSLSIGIFALCTQTQSSSDPLSLRSFSSISNVNTHNKDLHIVEARK